jgi:hypothetical protein
VNCHVQIDSPAAMSPAEVEMEVNNLAFNTAVIITIQ